MGFLAAIPGVIAGLGGAIGSGAAGLGSAAIGGLGSLGGSALGGLKSLGGALKGLDLESMGVGGGSNEDNNYGPSTPQRQLLDPFAPTQRSFGSLPPLPSAPGGANDLYRQMLQQGYDMLKAKNIQQPRDRGY